MAAGKLSSDQEAVLRLGKSALRRVTKLGSGGGGARLNVRSTSTTKSIKQNVMMHRKRILKAKKLKRKQVAAIKDQSSLHQQQQLYDLSGNVQKPLKKLLSTDSDELEVYGSSEEDQEDSIKQMGAEEDSGCDDWDLSKRQLKGVIGVCN